MTTQSVELQLSLNAPRAEGLPVTSIPLDFTASYDAKVEGDYPLVGSGSFSFQLAAAKPLKLLVLWADAQATAGVAQVALGAATPIPLRTGGCIVLFDPIPTSGVTTVTVTYSASMTVHAVGYG